MMEAEKMTTAQRVEHEMGADGQIYEAADGRTLDEIARAHGATVERGDGSYQEEADWHIDPTWRRYVFADGSAIVDCYAAWDVEGTTPWTWDA